MSFKNIPLGTPEEFNVVIEIPRGSSNKYEYDEELNAIRLDFVFRDDLSFPFDYGFIPETRAQDGDHLDAFILNPYPLQIGTIVKCRPIGMIEMLDRGEQDNKIIAVPVANIFYNLYQSINDLSEDEINKVRSFYNELAVQKNKKVEILGFHDTERAIEEIKRCRI